MQTDVGDVLFDTGLATQVPKQIKALNAAIDDLELSHIIVSHSHADHQGGVKFWKENDTQIITHAEFGEEQRYLKELQDYFWGRNRTLFPWMPETPPKLGLIAYGGVEALFGAPIPETIPLTGNLVVVEDDPSGTSNTCLLYTSPSPRDRTRSRMPSSA